jgi:hypothetical protein
VAVGAVTLLAAALAFAGCGGSGGGSTASTTTASNSTTDTWTATTNTTTTAPRSSHRSAAPKPTHSSAAPKHPGGQTPSGTAAPESSAAFRVRGADNSVAEYGAEAPASERRAAGAALRVKGDFGFAIYRAAHRAPYNSPLAREAGRWKVAALAPSALP